jgi:hypothetical protein
MIEIIKYSDIPGLGNFNLIYEELVSNLPPNASILEVGVGYGRGTWAMLDAMTEHMTLDVIDVLNSDGLSKTAFRDGSFPRTLTPKNYKRLSKIMSSTSQKEVFMNIISQHPKFSQLKHVHAMLSSDYISQNNRNNFDLVFLDGDHSYKTVSQELEYFKDCTVITGHDYNSRHPGVIKAVSKFLEIHKDRKLTTFDDECVFIIKKN